MLDIAVIDYGMGNLHSVASALHKVAPQLQVAITSDETQIRQAKRVILPGVGAIRDCMAEIRRLGIDELVREVATQKPLLAICVGLQALMTHSDENGGVACIDWFAGEVKHFPEGVDAQGQRLKIPHMGWNQVQQQQPHPLWANIPQGSRFYFVHSYYVAAQQRQWVSATCEYGVGFDAVLAKDNVFAVQFHPEKSQHAGLQLLQNFSHWDGHS